jgi:NitT/TauT family transport system substrate-binding protein
MQNRRHFLYGGLSTAAAGLAGASALVGARGSRAAEAPPETTSVRLPNVPGFTCIAPLDIVDDLLREEGFVDIRYVEDSAPTFEEGMANGEYDFAENFVTSTTFLLDAGVPALILAGVNSACLELRANDSIRSVLDLKGKRVWAAALWDSSHTMLPIIAARVGLDPARDIKWVFDTTRSRKDIFLAGEVDAFMTPPPIAQELRAENVGHVVLNTTYDRPWSEYFCCALIGRVDFVRRNPIATKRVVRAMMRATDICTAKPDWVAQRLVDRGITPRSDYARQGLEDVNYRAWRDFDTEDSVRFYALRLREVGMIKSSPDKIIATGTDFRFLNEVKREMGI